MIGTLKWKEDDRMGAQISSADDVASELSLIARQTTQQNGIAAVLNKPSNQELIVIMAGLHWALVWFPEDYQGVGSHHTVNEAFDPDTDELPLSPEVATYFIFGHHSEMPLEYTISEREALRGVREFFETTARPASLRWELD
jgi:hypothetical protein